MSNDLTLTNTTFKHKDIHKFTREVKSRGEKSIIDYFIVSREYRKAIKDVKVQRHAEIGSDHYLVRMEVIKKKEETKQTKRKIIIKEKIKSYRLKDEEIKKTYQNKLQNRLIREKAEKIKGIENKWKNFKENMILAAKESCGTTKTTNIHYKKSNWWTPELQQKIKDKKQKWRKYLRSQQEEDYDSYKISNREVKLAVKEAKKQSWAEFGEKMKEQYSENQKLFYGTLKQIRRKKTPRLVNIKDKKGNILTDEKDIMDRWKQYFEELTETNNEEQERETRQVRNNERNVIQPITEQEITQAINKLKIGKAAGQDDITPEMLKYMGEKARTVFKDLLNNIIRTKEIPQEWNIGIILPLYKKRRCKRMYEI